MAMKFKGKSVGPPHLHVERLPQSSNVEFGKFPEKANQPTARLENVQPFLVTTEIARDIAESVTEYPAMMANQQEGADLARFQSWQKSDKQDVLPAGKPQPSSVTDQTVSNSSPFDRLDTAFQSRLARMTSGISPAGLASDYNTWLNHLALAPGRLLELATFPWSQQRGNFRYAGPGAASPASDPRFTSESWRSWPWRLYAENFHVVEDWWLRATTKIPGLDKHTEQVVSFSVRQMLDCLSPTNFPLTNPDIFHETIRSSGRNLLRGGANALEDMRRRKAKELPVECDGYKVGVNLAVTPGKILFRNHLIELIQYEPQTTDVYKEPVLILPAWIMKYYILDLSPGNSLVKWLVAQGHTVFMVSWRNPDAADRDLSMDDYYRQGAMAAIDAVCAIIPQSKIHLTGYCLGGTLAMMTAATMSGLKDGRLQSLSLFAAQGDFTEAGELRLFVSESEIAYLEKMMTDQGFLDSRQMAGTFQMLHSNDLVWSKVIRDYLMGQRGTTIDLMAWDADATRMPAKMHGEYLEKLFLKNDFAEGRLKVEGIAVAPENLHLPVFALGTEKDHVAPWKSVYKIHLMADGPVTMALTSGGHNGGIVNPPGRKGHYYRIHERKLGEAYLAPGRWFERAELKQDASWWIAWQVWLAAHSTKTRIAPPEIGADSPPYEILCDAPGTYVLQR